MRYRSAIYGVLAVTLSFAGCNKLGGDLSDGQAAADLTASLKAGNCAQLYTVGDVTVLDRASATIPGDTSPATKVEAQVALSGTPALAQLNFMDDCETQIDSGNLGVLKLLKRAPTTAARVQGYWRKWQSGWRLERWNFE